MSSSPVVQSFSLDASLSEGLDLPSPSPLSPQSDSPFLPSDSSDSNSPIMLPSANTSHFSTSPHIVQSRNSLGGSTFCITPAVSSSPLLPALHSHDAAAAVVGPHLTTINSSTSSLAYSVSTFSSMSSPSSSYSSATAYSVTNRIPAFNLPSFQLSNMCHPLQQQHQQQLISGLLWPQRTIVQPFNPFYSPAPSSGPFQQGFSSSSLQHPCVGYRQPEHHIQCRQPPPPPPLYQNIPPVIHQNLQHNHYNNTQHSARRQGTTMMQAPSSTLQSSLRSPAPAGAVPVVKPPLLPLPYSACGPCPPLLTPPPAMNFVVAPTPNIGPSFRKHEPQQYHLSSVESHEDATHHKHHYSYSQPSGSHVMDSIRTADPMLMGSNSFSRQSSCQDDDDSVIFVSASSTGSRVVGPTPHKIIKPIPVRVLPPPSVFSWSRPVISPPPLVTNISHTCTSEIRRNIPSNIPSETSRPNSSSGQQQQPSDEGVCITEAEQGCHIIITEGDIDVGEQVTVETEESKTSASNREERLQEYRDFVVSFRSFRLSHNYTLLDVIHNVQSRFRRKVTLRSMTEFEDMVMEERRYIHIVALLKAWMEEVAKEKTMSSVVGQAQFHGIVPLCYRRRKIRTSAEVIWGLEEFFIKKRTPTSAEYRKMAREWKVEEAFVRCWFNDRRRKEIKGEMTCSQEELDRNGTPMLQKGIKIPSESHNISVEVSGWVSGGACFQNALPYHVFV